MPLNDSYSALACEYHSLQYFMQLILPVGMIFVCLFFLNSYIKNTFQFALALLCLNTYFPLQWEVYMHSITMLVETFVCRIGLCYMIQYKKAVFQAGSTRV